MFNRSGDPSRAMTPLPVADYLENSNSLRGNTYKLGGNNGQYDPALTGLPQPAPDTLRDDWKPIPRSPFHEGSLGGDDGLRRVLELVSAAVRD